MEDKKDISTEKGTGRSVSKFLKNKKRLLLRLFCMAMVSATAVSLSVTATSCGGKGDNKDNSSVSESVDNTSEGETEGEAGEYYFDLDANDGVDESVLTFTTNTFEMTLNGAAKSGSYKVEDGKYMLTFSDGTTGTVTLAENSLTLEYDGNTYTFLKKVNFTVTYETNGGSAVAAAEVMNGKMAQKPADPTKEGCYFIAWYKDAAFTQAYAFDAEAVTSNITLYARFETVNAEANQFEVEFVVDGAVVATQTTVNGTLYNLPVPEKEGATFAGWWVSQFGAADKLSYQYEEGQAVKENTQLFAVWEGNAPMISVNATGITWKMSGNVAQYSVKITAPDGTETTDTSAVNKYAYDFSAQAAGCYIVEVSANGQTATAYYNNKALAKVSLFKVEDSVLIFNAVENAEKYLITVVCGNEEHVHTELDNGNSTNYNFANCTMMPGGIQITVQAVAEGYVTSVSKMFTYSKDLEAVTGLAVDAATDMATWNAVANATAYVVEVKQGDVIVTETVAGTSFDLKEFSGDMQISVYPVAKNYNTPAAAMVSYTKANLATPKNVVFNGEKLVWDAVEGATGYTVKVGEKTYTTTATELAVSMDMYVQGQDAYEVTVQATSDTKGASAMSDAITVNFESMNTTLGYDKGIVTWAPVIMASHYTVQVNDGEAVTVNVGVNAYEVTLTKAGENVITVCAYNATTGAATQATMKVTAYEISFDTCGGSTVAPIYKAVGDKMNLPTAEMDGYAFDAWYNVAGGPANNGAKFTDEYFMTASDMLLYANWKSNTYTVTFDVGMYGEIEEQTAQVVFNNNFKLPVATSQDTSKVFGGWYESANGQGIQYTDADGNSIRPWYDAKDMTLHASWIDVLSYQLIDGGEAYAVSQGKGINRVTHVKVPETYNGKPVKMIEADAFKNCKTLQSIEIPDTISSIVLGTGGYTATGSAFYSCSNLKSITVYCVNGDHEANPHVTYYESIDGALIFNDPNDTSVKELIYIPGDKAGVYTIPSGVTHISSNVFKYSKLREVVIPATVTSIGENAFYSSDILTFTFKKAAEGEGEVPLVISANAFYSCDMTQITLPSRLETFNVDAFKGCKLIQKVYIDGEDGKYSSTADGMLCEAVLDDAGVATANKKIVYCPVARAGSYEIPVGVTEIGDSAFYDCDGLSEIIIPGYVTKIGAKAFYGCDGLFNIDISNDVFDLKIGDQAFYNCVKVEKVYIPAGVSSIGTKAFQGCSEINSLTFSADAATVIGEQAFYDLDNITALEIPAGVTMIGKAAFKNCGGLLTLDFRGREGDPALTISDEAFMGCSGLTSLVLPENLVKLGVNAFGSTTKLTTVYVYVGQDAVLEKYAFGSSTAASAKYYVETLHIGKNAPAMEISAIFGVDQLANIVVDAGNENYASEDGVLFDKDKTMILYYPAAKQGEYRIPNTVTKIGSNVFDTKTGLTKVIIGAQVTEISEYAFTNCAKLAEIYFEPTAEGQEEVELVIGPKAFYQSKALATINIPTRTTTIGAEAFRGCEALTEIVIPEGITELEDRTFQDCEALKKITLPSTLTDIGTANNGGALLFYSSYKIEEIVVAENNKHFATIDGILYGKDPESAENAPISLIYVPGAKAGKVTVPATVTNVWSGAFCEKDLVTEVEFEDHKDGTTVTLGERVFYKGASLKKVILPEGLVNIPIYTFYYNPVLTEVVVSNTVETIEASSFYQLLELEKITYEEGGTAALRLVDGQVQSSSSSATYYGVFRNLNAPKYTNVVFPERTTHIGSYAFYEVKSIASVTLPSTLQELGDYAFAYCSALTTVTFAENGQLKKIGNDVFYQSGITSIDLPETVESIGNYAFAYTDLTEIEIPASVKQLGVASTSSSTTYASVFSNTPLTKVTFAEGSQLEVIYGYTFTDCTKLTSIELPASLKTLGDRAFDGCTSLTSVTFEEGSQLESIGTYAFTETALQRFDFPDSTSTLTLGTHLFAKCRQLTTIYLSKSVVNLDNVLAKCSSIRTVIIAEDNENFKSLEGSPLVNNVEGTTIMFAVGELKDDVFTVPEGVKTIGPRAFEGQPFKKIILPKSLETIDTYAFLNCQQLEEVVFAEDGRLETIGEEAFHYCRSLKSLNLPDSVLTIGKQAFAGCSKLASIEWSANLESIGEKSFAGCSSLESVTVPGTLQTIGTYAFAYSGLKTATVSEGITILPAALFNACANLSQVSLPESLTTLNNYALAFCPSLKEVKLPANCNEFGEHVFRESGIESFTFPAGVTKVNNYMFYNCGSLTTVVLTDDITAIGNYAFQGCSSLANIDLPSTVTSVGTSAFVSTAITSMDLSNVTTINASIFSNCKLLTDVKLNSGLTQLKDNLFKGCISLKTVEIPAGVTYLGKNTFENCTGLTEITLPSNLKLLGASATSASSTTAANTFTNCTSLTTINLENIEKMSKSVFKGCTSLKEVNLAKLTQLGAENFMDCTSLTKVTFGKKVTTVGKQAFANCTSLTEVNFNSTQASVGTYLFENCTSLKTITLPKTITTIGEATFSGCTALTTVDASGAKTIGANAFANCTSLSNYTIPTTVTSIGANAFNGCTALTSITIPTSVTVLSDFAFANTSITSLHIPAKVKTITGAAFDGCDTLKTITWDTANTNFKFGANGEVYNAAGTSLIYYPANSANNVVDLRGSGITTMGKYAFAMANNVTEVYLPDTMTTIPTYAFANAPSLVTVHIPSTITSIAANAFDGCTKLGDLVLPESITALSSKAFQNATMKSIQLPATLETIGTNAFDSATVSTIEIPSNVYSIGNNAFRYSNIETFIWAASTNEGNPATIGTYVWAESTTLKKVVLPEGLEKLNSYAFQLSTALEEVSLPSTLKTIAGYAFKGCTSLQAIVLPEGLEEFSSTYVFQDCTALKEVVIPEGVPKITNYMFANCTALVNVVIPETVTTIATQAFANCTALKEITIPSSVDEVQNRAFLGWTAEQTIYFEGAQVDMNKNWATSESYSYTSITISCWNTECEAKVVLK